jgi:enterochelin esterase-like enzyme
MGHIPNVRSYLILLLLAVFFLQSCRPAALPVVKTGPAAMETGASPGVFPRQSAQETPQITLPAPEPTLAAATLTKSETPIPSSITPILAACMQAKGGVDIEDISTDLLPQPLQYHIYLPPCYNVETGRRYPVLYLIHGKDATDSQWVNLGVPDTLDRLVANGELAPFIVVMPRDWVWNEPVADNFGLAVVQVLVPWVDEHYRTLPERSYRAIGGLSRGGAWAVHIGFSHPELFGAVGLHSSVVFNTDVTSIGKWVNDFPDGMTPRIYIDIGDNDRPDITQETTWVEQLLSKYGIAHEWHMGQGGHDADYWGAHVEEYLRWYGQDWSSEPGLNGKPFSWH